MSRHKRYPKGTWMKLQSKETLGALIAQRRFSYGRLARYAGCSKSFVSHLTSGRKSTCTPELAGRIAEALEVPIELLFVAAISTDGGQISSDQRRAS